MKLARYFNTIRYLKGKQLVFQVLHRIKPKLNSYLGFKYPTFIDQKGDVISLSGWIRKPALLSNDNLFCFLNICSSFEGNWNNQSNGKLWCYNLNYMDFLCQPELAPEYGITWLKRFIKDLPSNKVGKDPYPTALRNINWIKFMTENASSVNPEDKRLIDGALSAGYHYLSRNLEYHLLGNHLIENAFSLLFGSFYFRDQNLYNKASQIILKEIDEQVLADGGHFELSPMYHEIILEHLLDCINLLQSNRNIFPSQDSLLEILKMKGAIMLGWLKQILFNDDEIPLLNDSAYHIAPPSSELFKYADRLNVKLVEIPLSDSGYRKFKGKRFECIADIGKIGPDYLPGHSHSDTFSFVMNVQGMPFIVDTGVSTYNKDSRRDLERCTESHNTVSVNGWNSSDVWGGFRTGKRARVETFLDNPSEIIAEHDGFRPKSIHRRHFIFDENNITIIDEITGSLPGISSLHFHPNSRIDLSGNKLKFNNCHIELSGFERIELAEYLYCPEFNKMIPALKFRGIFYKSSCIKIMVYEN